VIDGLNRRRRLRCWRARFDPHSALRAQNVFGEGRHVPVGPIGLSDRRQCPHCRRAHFAPRSAPRAWDRIAGGGEGESGKRRHRMSPVGQEPPLVTKPDVLDSGRNVRTGYATVAPARDHDTRTTVNSAPSMSIPIDSRKALDWP
jgi:hypothetical protein